MTFDCIVVALHLRYDGIRQRPHHILARLAERVPVLVVEEPLSVNADANELTMFGNLTRLRPKRLHAARYVDETTLDEVERWVGARAPLLWFYQPMMLALRDRFPGAPVVYDCMDELAAFEFASPELPANEERLMRDAGQVFTGGRSIFEKRRHVGPKVRLFASGVDVDHFARAATNEPPQILTALAHPICTYIGAIDERVDFAPVRALAERGASVVLVGPVVKIDPARLPQHPNVHFTGPVPYDDLPPLLAGTDVAIMPFALNDATRSISPTKTPEYLAARRPIVTTAVPDVVADFGDVVHVASDASAFADACFAVAAQRDEAWIARGAALARNHRWDDIVDRMWRTIEDETALT